MDINNLNDIEVRKLIESLKNSPDNIVFSNPLDGKIKDDTPLTDYSNGIEYKFFRYRHPIDSSRFSLHIRFLENHYHLIRIDINNGNHRNPDQKKIQNNHMHIYDSRFENKDEFAIPLPNEIKNISDIIGAMEDFFKYANIK